MTAGAPPTSYAGAGGNGVQEPRTPGEPLLGVNGGFSRSKGEKKSAKVGKPLTPSATRATLIELDAIFLVGTEGFLEVNVGGLNTVYVNFPGGGAGEAGSTQTFIVPAGVSWEVSAAENTILAEIPYTQYIEA